MSENRRTNPLGFARATSRVQFGKWIHTAVSHDGNAASTPKCTH